jgi:uncharacterized repeat protein (TIGR02543 family)
MWNATYTVTFNANGATSGTAPTAQTAGSGSSVTLPNGSGLTKTGYTFGGWNTNSSGTGTNYNAGASYTVTGNITLYAKWNATYTVTFNANGGSDTAPAAQTANSGSSVILPSGSGLTKTGYTFGGWNTNADGTGNNYAAFSFYTVTANITLYAKWIIEGTATYTVTFNANGATSGTTPTAQTASSGSSVTLPSGSGLTKTSYTFGGWNTNAEGTGTNYAANASYTVTATVTLYAKWDAVPTYTVTFDANGGSGTAPTAQTASSGSSVTLPNGSGLTKTGCTFGGWNTNSSSTGTNYNAGASYTVTGNITLYAKWNATVTFNINGATSGTAPTAQTANYGSSVTLPSGSGLTKTGYTFDGWNTNSSGTETNYNAGASYTVTGNITLYAKWVIPGGTTNDAIPLTENQWADGNIPKMNGVQWFTFTATAATQYIQVAAGAIDWSRVSADDDGYIIVLVYTSDGVIIDNTATRVYAYPTGSTSRSLTVGQTYYIRVTLGSIITQAPGTYRIGFNTTFIPPGVTPIPPLTANQWAAGNRPTSGGPQWFTFTATASTQYIHFDWIGTLTGVNMRVYDSSGVLQQDQTGYDSFARIRGLTTGQTYYIQVWRSNSGGTYRITFNASTTPPQ